MELRLGRFFLHFRPTYIYALSQQKIYKSIQIHAYTQYNCEWSRPFPSIHSTLWQFGDGVAVVFAVAIVADPMEMRFKITDDEKHCRAK